MKPLATMFVGALCATLAVAAERRPRDLYLDGGANPGAKVAIELDRNGQKTMVAPTTVFQTGDRIRLHFSTNFTGYLFVYHKGSTGQEQLMFPQKGVPHRVQANAQQIVPSAGWMVFDQNAGQELVGLVFAAKAIPELEQIAAAVGASDATVPPPTTASAGGPASATEEQEILNALNARGMKTRSRDLRLQVDGNEGYVLANNSQQAQEPLVLEWALTHK